MRVSGVWVSVPAGILAMLGVVLVGLSPDAAEVMFLAGLGLATLASMASHFTRDRQSARAAGRAHDRDA
jgi:hypothetical protein